MRKTDFFAASFLGIGFACVSYVMLVVEPGMGFESPRDYFDPRKVAAGYASAAWLVTNVLYLAFPIAVMVIACSVNDRLLQWFGVGAALLGLVLASVDRVGIQLSALLPTNEAAVDAVAAMLPIRFAILKATVVALGLFAWRTTRSGTTRGAGPRVWRGFGWVVLVASVGFVFAFIPVPVVFSVWGVVLAIRYFSAAPRGPDHETRDV